jgi:hypothetical protein
MDRYDREAKIRELRDANDASRAEIARREAELAADPLGFDLVKFADRRATGLDSDLAYTDARGEPAGEAHMLRTDSRGMLYRQNDDALPAPAPASALTPSSGDDEWKGWNDWLRAHLDNERADLLDIVARALSEIVDDTCEKMRREFEAAIVERDVKIAKLEAQAELLLRMYLPTKTGEIIEIPKGIVRRVQNNE